MDRPVRKLLIVDDDSDDRRAYARLLRSAPDYTYEIVAATEVSEGLAAARAQHFDCILLDMHLPDGSALDFLSELSKLANQSSCAVVVITGHGNEAVAVDAMKRGAGDYLLKSGLTQEILVHSIDHAMTRWALQTRLDRSFEVSTETNTMLQLEVEERRKAESDAAAEKERAVRANEAKTAFLTNMSHEIRTPMNGILGMSSLLLETELDDEQRQYANAIRSSTTGLLVLLNDILDLSKLEAGCIDLEDIDFDLEELIEGTLELIAPKAIDKELELCALIDESARRHFIGDPTRLRQVLLNLIGNAVKFTEIGHVMVRARQIGPVETADGVAAARLRIEVSDSGIGISAEGMRHLFQKFNQADASIVRRFGGTGLGLAISRELSELMGGVIDVESEAGKGSTFALEITLPHGAKTAPPPAWLGRLAGCRALVVDNFEMTRQALRLHLERIGIDVAEAHDGFSAIAELRRASANGSGYDVVLVDQIMPGMSGEELVQETRNYPALAAVKLILVSPFGFALKEKGTERAPIDAMLTKPPSYKALVECLANLMFPNEKLVNTSKIGFLSDHGAEIRQRQMRRILLAEDNVINQQVAAGILRKAGYAVDVAADGFKAVSAAAVRKYDLILMDLQMPGMGGVEALQAIRSLEGLSHVPVIAMTAHAMRGSRAECLAFGMDDYIAKPIDPRGFLALVRRWTIGVDSGPTPASADAVAEPEQSRPVLDEHHLAALRASMDGGDFDELIANAPARLQGRIEKLQSALAAADFATLEHEAHSLISGAGNVGAMALSGLALELEDGASQKDRDATAKTMRAIAANLPLTVAALGAKTSGALGPCGESLA